MSQEIELKFEIDPSSMTALCHFLHTQHINERHKLHLGNTYYDCNDHLLRSNSMSLRIRSTHEKGKPDVYEITLKSSSSSLAGLHTRNEFNAYLPDNRLDLFALPANSLPNHLDRQLLSSQLIALFSTHFDRQTWLINYQKSQIEVALDQGLVSTVTASQPILEVELELKAGYQDDLLRFAIELSQFNLHLFSQSKAARGYRLLLVQPLPKIAHLVTDDSSSLFILSDILQYWQTNEECALAYHDLTVYQQTLYQVQQKLKPILSQVDDDKCYLLKAVYLRWCEQVATMTDIKKIAFSAINTQLKLLLMLSMQTSTEEVSTLK